MKIKLYGKTNCPQCRQAQHLLIHTQHTDFDYLMLDVDYTQEELKSIAGPVKSLPVIVIGETVLKSVRDLMQWTMENGK